MKPLVREHPEVARNQINGGMTVKDGCCHCGGDLTWSSTLPRGAEQPIRCGQSNAVPHGCGEETAVTVLDEYHVSLRLPYGCDAWHSVDSSNIEAIGRNDGYLVIRFKSGVVYRYPGLHPELDRLLRAPSKGQYFHRAIRNKPTERLCAVYGCFRPAERDGNHNFCALHLHS